MEEIIGKIFKYYHLRKIWEDESIKFYTNTSDNIVSYFITNYVDCSNAYDGENDIKEKLSRLEKEYVDEITENNGIKYSIIDSFVDKQAAGQIDKNTSAIYLVKFSEVDKLPQFRNIIYSIEESPIYFRRYILPYTDMQVTELKKVLSDYKEKNIVDIFTDLANDENNYYRLMDGKNNNSAYELVIRLFSKIPFLQYRFTANADEISLEKKVDDALDEKLKKYDEIVKNNQIDIEHLLTLESDNIMSEDEINAIINRMMEEIE